MPLASSRRALAALLALSLAAEGCAAVRLKEHRHPGPAVSVKVVWDDEGATRLVAGVHARLEPFGDPPLEGVTRADAPLLFDFLKPGLHRLVLTAPGMKPIERTFDLRPERRVSVKVLVDAFERARLEHGDQDDDDDSRGLFVLKVVGAVLVVGLVVLAIAVIDGALDDDDDERCVCETSRRHRRGEAPCWCACHS